MSASSMSSVSLWPGRRPAMAFFLPTTLAPVTVSTVDSREHGVSMQGFLLHRKALHILFRTDFFPDSWGMITEFISYQTVL